ncbi:MBL fold metallo-hydrolase [Brevibacillus agri]|uniref:MBL fold metallo-hydrolase n=1 Tax=Brevibacillus TaxID=55080 RepID=UPI000271AA62|nr:MULTISPECIES: MBL fold metallo-hydrolase [Brevibacillus]EJL44253.1 putative Zn-dependent hydrolase of beta-lactamase [Brevibacillus sp. CF112]MBY0054585.1 MBL fold metallo-hydrolase [Brevibacillus agri]MCG5253478.1 MBL fold metallo-hydrolase [Brevibacillus agri]MDR9504194.1 MBL fold metallo-hydrolase [Brevibacillus agri]MED1643288.1 MBL fold metallo-hydrolase [Brevibacillus agri]
MQSTILIWLGYLLGLLVVGFFGYVAYRYWYHMGQLPKPPFRELDAKPAPENWSDDEVTFTWIGHSTILLNVYGTKILTDPVLGEKLGLRVAGLLHFGPRRFTPPALDFDEIGSVDLILLSHAHMDHVDLPTLRRLAHPYTHVITASNTGKLLRRMPFASCKELAPGQATTTKDGVTVTAIPVRHWGNRFPWNHDYGYNGYVIEKNGVRILYPGDTAYMSMESLPQEFGQFDLVFMPIGAYKPDSYQAAHCTPEQAWQMFKESRGKWLAPIHWNTFVLSREPVDEPMQRLLAAAGEEKNRIIVERQGETFTLPVR